MKRLAALSAMLTLGSPAVALAEEHRRGIEESERSTSPS